MTHISIIGLGEKGTSLGLALQWSLGRECRVIGCDKDRQAAFSAKRLKAVNKIERSFQGAAESADLVFIAAPTHSVRDILERISPFVKEGCVVTDMSSNMGQVIQWAEDTLPPGVSFVGGHPLGSPPTPNSAHAFRDRIYCITPSRKAGGNSVERVVQIVRKIGARPLFIDAQEHDAFFCAMALLPFFLSAIFNRITRRNPQWKEMAWFSTELASHMISEASKTQNLKECLINRQGLARWLDDFSLELRGLRTLIDGPEGPIREAMQESASIPEGPSDSHAGQRPMDDMPKMGHRVASLFVGEGILRRLKMMGYPPEESGGKRDE